MFTCIIDFQGGGPYPICNVGIQYHRAILPTPHPSFTCTLRSISTHQLQVPHELKYPSPGTAPTI